jgi:hypothetical protein
MSHAFIISTLGETDLRTDATYFEKQLRKQWPDAEIHVITDPQAHSVLQWKIMTQSKDLILGDLYGEQSVAFKGGDRTDVVNFALWYRTIVPLRYKLYLYKEDLSHQPIELTADVTIEDILAGFDAPFAPDFESQFPTKP